MFIRPLTPADVADYRQLRLASLREYPEAFVTDASEEEALSDDEPRQRLDSSQPHVTFGAFVDRRLTGVAALVRMTRIRQQFRALIAGMYVEPRHAPKASPRALIEAALEQAGRCSEVEEVCLCITIGNERARRLYVSCGFEPDFIDPRYFKFEGRYYDLEWLRRPVVS